MFFLFLTLILKLQFKMYFDWLNRCPNEGWRRFAQLLWWDDSMVPYYFCCSERIKLLDGYHMSHTNHFIFQIKQFKDHRNHLRWFTLWRGVVRLWKMWFINQSAIVEVDKKVWSFHMIVEYPWTWRENSIDASQRVSFMCQNVRHTMSKNWN